MISSVNTIGDSYTKIDDSVNKIWLTARKRIPPTYTLYIVCTRTSFHHNNHILDEHHLILNPVREVLFLPLVARAHPFVVAPLLPLMRVDVHRVTQSSGRQAL